MYSWKDGAPPSQNSNTSCFLFHGLLLTMSYKVACFAIVFQPCFLGFYSPLTLDSFLAIYSSLACGKYPILIFHGIGYGFGVIVSKSRFLWKHLSNTCATSWCLLGNEHRNKNQQKAFATFLFISWENMRRDIIILWLALDELGQDRNGLFCSSFLRIRMTFSECTTDTTFHRRNISPL